MIENTLQSYWPLIVFAVLVLAVNALMILISFFAGEKHRERTTGEIYESGVGITGDTRIRFSVHFYVIAMFFVIFDVEAVFLISWAIVLKDVGWPGYWSMFVFVMILMVVLFYEWRTGALDFGPSGKEILKAHRKISKQ